MSRVYFPPPGNDHYEQDPEAKPIDLQFRDGTYVFVQALDGVIWAALDRREHQHVTLLGGTKSVLYAGDLELKAGKILSITNCSGTFCPNDKEGLRAIARCLEKMGFRFAENALKFCFWDVYCDFECLEWK